MNAALAAALVLLASSADLAAPLNPRSIIGGSEVDPCAWPSTARVSVGGTSSGAVLIHPRVVAFDNQILQASPGAGELTFTFGIAAGAIGPPGNGLFVDAPVAACDADGNFAVCTLEEPVPLAYAPPLVGCELGDLGEGSELTISGFGNVGDVTNREKRAGPVTVTDVSGTGFVYVEGDTGPCVGDVGSPAFLRMDDGSWRTVAIAAGIECGGPATYVGLTTRIPWIEEVTGFDVTPCHDADGFPEPGPDCEGFFAGDAGDFGAWDMLCSDGPVGGSGGVCSGDKAAPSVTIDTPRRGATYADVPSTVVVEASADDGRGLGVRDVRLSINDEILPNERTEPPYSFEVNLPEGIWTLTALARDWGGNASESSSITVVVGDPPLPMPGSSSGGPDETGDPTDDTAGSMGSTGDTADAGTTGLPGTGTAMPGADTGDTDASTAGQNDGGGGGCSVAPNHHGRGWLLCLAGLGLVAFARRRRSL